MLIYDYKYCLSRHMEYVYNLNVNYLFDLTARITFLFLLSE